MLKDDRSSSHPVNSSAHYALPSVVLAFGVCPLAADRISFLGVDSLVVFRVLSWTPHGKMRSTY